MSKKLKIAIYSGTIPSSTFIENLIEGIADTHDVYLFGKQREKVQYKNRSVKVCPIYQNSFKNLIISILRSLLLLIKFPKRLIILFKTLKGRQTTFSKYQWFTRYLPVLLNLPEIFHIQWAKDVPHWFFLKEEFGCKIVLSLRGAHINYSPVADKDLAEDYRKYFPKIDAFHAVSEAIGMEAQKYGADPTKITTIHSVISETALAKYKSPDAVNDSLSIVSVGRYHWIKDYQTALDACYLLKQQQISFTYTIIASEKTPEDLLFQRNQLNLTDEVIFFGSLPQDELFDKIQQCEVLLLPSLKEGLANVVLEAMALGLPVISTDDGGMTEIIIEDQTGWLIPVSSAEAMSDALIRFYKTLLPKRKEVAEKAHNFVKKSFQNKKSLDKFKTLYKNLNTDD